jgi:hypothetical protein
MVAQTQLTREQVLRRLGAVCLIVGSMMILIFRVLHGDLPADQGGGPSLSYVASYPIYAIDHLLDALGFLVFAGGLFALSDSLTNAVAWAVGRLGAASALIGVIIQMFEHLADGYTLTSLARQWAAPGADHATLESGAELALAMLGGPAVISLSIVWGLTLILYGVAVRKEGYSAVFGWVGVILGSLVFFMGIAQYVRPNLYPGFLLYGGAAFAAHLWAILLGIAMWRRTSA